MLRNLKKHFSSKTSPLSFAIIGSGPGGFYTSKLLLNYMKDIRVDIFEKLPHPFGLIRNGVAPDHQDVKKIMTDFTEVLDDSRVRFFGNISIGEDISFKVLQENYSGVVIAYGADYENKLDLINEDKHGCFSARRFVNWYNGHVEYSNMDFPLDSENCVIIGNGNCAIDIARMLTKEYEDLKRFDIEESILEKLSNNKVRDIHMIARRGILQSAFTIKEIGELASLKNLKVFVFQEDLMKSVDDLSMSILNATDIAEKKHIIRKLELIKTFEIVKDENDLHRKLDKTKKNLILRFFMAPTQILTNNDVVNSVIFNKANMSLGENKKLISHITETKAAQINTRLLMKSIGFKSTKLFNEVKFSDKTNTIVHVNGKVFDHKNEFVKNVFTVGWVKRGAQGIIDQTFKDVNGTIETVIESIKDNLITPKTPDIGLVLQNLEKNNVKYVNSEQWRKLDDYEISEGKKKNKLREKIVSKEKMIEIAHS